MKQLLEKIIGTTVICLLLSCMAGIAQTESIYEDTSSGIHRTFTVPRQRFFSPTNACDFAAGFPSLDLDRLANQAALHLRDKKGVQQKLRLFNVRIVPIAHAKALRRLSGRVNGKDADKEVCYLMFWFGYATGEQISFFRPKVDYVVLMLLDGTIAHEEQQ